ncbi:peroxiredoxin [Candidatus Dependentiae bacterium]|nr:peroxiredoxin [Candidatus Dependentiae bacterium]
MTIERTIGKKAPDFSLKDEKSTIHTLSTLIGKKVALIFYPKPNTPGCTKEVCNLRDNYSTLKDADIVILGISAGSTEKMKSFKDNNSLNFPLLGATDQVLKNYQTTGDFWSLYLPKRHTFLIDEKGVLVAIIKNVEVKDHAQQILKEFKKLQNTTQKGSSALPLK